MRLPQAKEGIDVKSPTSWVGTLTPQLPGKTWREFLRPPPLLWI